MGSACGTYERRITINRILVGGSEGRRPLGRRRSRWEDKKKWTFKKSDGRALSGLIWLMEASDGLL
jgi:hypothetical protein